MNKIFINLIAISFIGITVANSENRKFDIVNTEDLSREIIYLISDANLNDNNEYTRILKYVSKNAEKKNQLLNNLNLYKTDNKKESSNLNLVIEQIKKNIISLENNNIPKNGEWTGQAGHSNFIITGHTKEYSKDEVLEIAPEGIPFEFGYPNFESFRIGNIFILETPTASLQHDTQKMIDVLISRGISFNGIFFTSYEEFEKYLYFNNAKLNYSLHENGLELIPNQILSVIDFKVPHISKRQ
jgi:hypothetical protein